MATSLAQPIGYKPQNMHFKQKPSPVPVDCYYSRSHFLPALQSKISPEKSDSATTGLRLCWRRITYNPLLLSRWPDSPDINIKRNPRVILIDWNHFQMTACSIGATIIKRIFTTPSIPHWYFWSTVPATRFFYGDGTPPSNARPKQVYVFRKRIKGALRLTSIPWGFSRSWNNPMTRQSPESSLAGCPLKAIWVTLVDWGRLPLSRGCPEDETAIL